MKIKRIIAFILATLCLSLCSCGLLDKEEEKKAIKEQKDTTYKEVDLEEKDDEGEDKEEDEIGDVEVIYATSPQEAADKCISAFKSGKLSDARHYVTPDGKAFKELGSFRSEMIKSLGVSGKSDLAAKAERLVNNVLKHFVYTKTQVKTNDDKATVVYEVSMPDTSNIAFSKSTEYYMASIGMSQEQLMSKIEGMSEKEAEAWSVEFGIDVMNYVFENETNFPRKTSSTVVLLEKHKSGWLVSDIKNK